VLFYVFFEKMRKGKDFIVSNCVYVFNYIAIIRAISITNHHISSYAERAYKS